MVRQKYTRREIGQRRTAPINYHRNRQTDKVEAVVRIEYRLTPQTYIDALLTSVIQDFPRFEQLPDTMEPHEIDQRVRRALHDVGTWVSTWESDVLFPEIPDYRKWGRAKFNEIYPDVEVYRAGSDS